MTTHIASQQTPRRFGNQQPGTQLPDNQLPNEPIRACPLCDRDNRDTACSVYSAEPWVLRECAGCQFVYLENPLTYEQLKREHCWSKTAIRERSERLERQPLMGPVRHGWKQLRVRLFPHPKAVTWIKKYLKGPRVLDIGCGQGRLLRNLGEQIIPYGIEIDQHARRASHSYAQSRGGTVFLGDALAELSQQSADAFDAVIMLSFLEHETQPLSVLQQVSRVMKPAGISIIKVPNYACWNRHLMKKHWSGFRFPDHVNYFTPQTLKQLLEKAELRVQRNTIRDRFPTSDNMWFLVSKEAA